ncbi:MAG TPA: sulfotransferase [Streptosporangiaceae bacterium]|nr:sulfotransferase [Streptosporangiaceae bacterium]
MALPDFLVIGAPKAGTTALHVALASHPELFTSPVKEPKFFLTDGPPPRRGGPGDVQTYREHVWRREAYEALFGAAPPGTLRGESTPFYLYDRQAQQRIRALIPGARLIAVLRDPVERAHSNWTHLWSAGLDPIGDFPAACAAEDRRVAAGWAPFWHYTRLGRYGEQLDHLLTVFPREQVFVLRYRDLVDAPTQALDAICSFLGSGRGSSRRCRARMSRPTRSTPPATGPFPWCCGRPPPPAATCRAPRAPPSPSRWNGTSSAARAPASP